MDSEKLHYFVMKYRGAEPDEILELGSRIDSLSEEAEAALRQVAEERKLALSPSAQPTTSRIPVKQAARIAEERAYSEVAAEIIHVRKIWFLWSLPLAFGAGLIYRLAADSVRSTLMGPPVALFGLFALVWPLYCLYKLSRAVDPKRSVAWAMVAVCFIPIVGWIAPISLVLKAGRIRRAAIAGDRGG